MPRDNDRVPRRAFSVAAALLLTPAPALAQDSCRLCFGDPGAAPGERPLQIEISADLSFSRLAMTGRGGGSATVDPATGAKRTTGDLADLGGMAVTGYGRITGEPLRQVRVDLPAQVPMSAGSSTTAYLTDFTTTLPAHPVLDGNGVLEFRFGARLQVSGRKGGNYRGRIAIQVDYN